MTCDSIVKTFFLSYLYLTILLSNIKSLKKVLSGAFEVFSSIYMVVSLLLFYNIGISWTSFN